MIQVKVTEVSRRGYIGLIFRNPEIDRRIVEVQDRLSPPASSTVTFDEMGRGEREERLRDAGELSSEMEGQSSNVLKIN